VSRVFSQDLFHHRFAATAPDPPWYVDLTAIRTGEGFRGAAVILDAFNRQVISRAPTTARHPRNRCARYETPSPNDTRRRLHHPFRSPLPIYRARMDRPRRAASLVVSIGERKRPGRRGDGSLPEDIRPVDPSKPGPRPAPAWSTSSGDTTTTSCTRGWSTAAPLTTPSSYVPVRGIRASTPPTSSVYVRQQRYGYP